MNGTGLALQSWAGRKWSVLVDESGRCAVSIRVGAHPGPTRHPWRRSVQQSSASPILADTAPDSRADIANPTQFRPANRRVSAEVLKARIRRYNSDLDPASPAFGAALVLIAGAEYGHNVDVLAKRTGLSRSFVARCARRLIDNGVWEAGRTVAEWEPGDPASGTFWNDVAVAEGKMCRREAPDGALEWAPAGFWNKNFHFLDPDADNRLGNHYMDSMPEPESEAEESVEDEGSDADMRVEAEVGTVEVEPLDDGLVTPIETLLSETPDSELSSRETTADSEPPPVSEPADDEADVLPQDSVPSLRHVFRDAVWLG